VYGGGLRGAFSSDMVGVSGLFGGYGTGMRGETIVCSPGCSYSLQLAGLNSTTRGATLGRTMTKAKTLGDVVRFLHEISPVSYHVHLPRRAWYPDFRAHSVFVVMTDSRRFAHLTYLMHNLYKYIVASLLIGRHSIFVQAPRRLQQSRHSTEGYPETVRKTAVDHATSLQLLGALLRSARLYNESPYPRRFRVYHPIPFHSMK
jgi:hypothetical protein